MPYKTPRLYSIKFGCTSTNPADSTTYYFANINRDMNATSTDRFVLAPKPGIIRYCIFDAYASGGVNGSDETWTFLIQINSTDYTFTSKAESAAHRTIYATNLNIPVVLGDKIRLKTTTPAWASNPTGVICEGTMLIETT